MVKIIHINELAIGVAVSVHINEIRVLLGVPASSLGIDRYLLVRIEAVGGYRYRYIGK